MDEEYREVLIITTASILFAIVSIIITSLIIYNSDIENYLFQIIIQILLFGFFNMWFLLTIIHKLNKILKKHG